MNSFLSLFAGSSYAPHGYCLLWQPALIWTHVISDALIAAAYFSIPAALISLVRRRKDIAFGPMLGLFAVFICACGSTHVLAIWNLWHGDYMLEGVVKAITAAASVPTAIILWPLIPKVLAIPSPALLQSKNEELADLISERDAAVARLTAEVANRKRAEDALAQRQKIEAVGKLTGGIAHDFNNLLQAVGGNLDLIRQRPDDAPRVSRWASNAIKGVDRGVRLSSQLLAFSRTQRLRLEPVDLGALLEEASELMHRSTGAGIVIDITADPSCMVQGDPTQLELAVLNILHNARDAMPGGGKVDIRLRQVEVGTDDTDLDAGTYCELAISDTGHGMAPDIALRATEPFFTTKDTGKGTGLGLSTAFGMARQSGGTLRIHSTEGGGTTVSILLRSITARSEGKQPERYEDQRAIFANPPQGTHVMLVDDDEDVRQVITDTIDALGYTCESFSSGPAALDVLASRRPDVLVLDFAMPGMNGAEVAHAARALQPGLRIIFISGFADSAAIDGAMDVNSSQLRKPFRSNDLAVLLDGRLSA